MTKPSGDQNDHDMVHILCTGDPPIEGALYTAHFVNGRTSDPVARFAAREIVGLYPGELAIEEIEKPEDEAPAQAAEPQPVVDGDPPPPDPETIALKQRAQIWFDGLDDDAIRSEAEVAMSRGVSIEEIYSVHMDGVDDPREQVTDRRREKTSDIPACNAPLPVPETYAQALNILCARAMGKRPTPKLDQEPLAKDVGKPMFSALKKQAFAHFPQASHPHEFRQLMKAKDLIGANDPSIGLPEVDIGSGDAAG